MRRSVILTAAACAAALTGCGSSGDKGDTVQAAVMASEDRSADASDAGDFTK